MVQSKRLHIVGIWRCFHYGMAVNDCFSLTKHSHQDIFRTEWRILRTDWITESTFPILFHCVMQLVYKKTPKHFTPFCSSMPFLRLWFHFFIASFSSRTAPTKFILFFERLCRTWTRLTMKLLSLLMKESVSSEDRTSRYIVCIARHVKMSPYLLTIACPHITSDGPAQSSQHDWMRVHLELFCCEVGQPFSGAQVSRCSTSNALRKDPECLLQQIYTARHCVLYTYVRKLNSQEMWENLECIASDGRLWVWSYCMQSKWDSHLVSRVFSVFFLQLTRGWETMLPEVVLSARAQAAREESSFITVLHQNWESYLCEFQQGLAWQPKQLTLLVARQHINFHFDSEGVTSLLFSRV